MGDNASEILCKFLTQGVFAFDKVFPTPWRHRMCDSEHRDDFDITDRTDRRITTTPDDASARRICMRTQKAVQVADGLMLTGQAGDMGCLKALAEGIEAFQYFAAAPWKIVYASVSGRSDKIACVVTSDFQWGKEDVGQEIEIPEEQRILIETDLQCELHDPLMDIVEIVGHINSASARVRDMYRLVIDDEAIAAALHLEQEPVLHHWARRDAERLATCDDERLRNLARAYRQLSEQTGE